MKRTRTSNAWLREHVNDPYVQRARAEGYRSRASFKLMEIDDRDHLIHSGEVVVDLGATPGGLFPRGEIKGACLCFFKGIYYSQIWGKIL